MFLFLYRFQLVGYLLGNEEGGRVKCLKNLPPLILVVHSAYEKKSIQI